MVTDLDSVPVEVKMVILQSIGSYRDLIRPLHASSIFYRIYLLSPAQYLRASSAGEHTAGIVKELVAVHLATVQFTPVVSSDQAARVPALAKEFFGEYFDAEKQRLLPRSHKELRSII
ncbi:hypothetical protein LMH87_011229 [Akanthomyces muscarius]|uniref:Uncharacterized protein n=1 Tax=Akanthomyces muscarius TaxID=2231603 RepID=A0A9W8QA87_AKAMU|nr:hypothetical protein LMH87_011229 [Akanthomyces muscarius]KAJ4150481.1 hypothetical protein LMH87_011229 [Akanthomyces muscarius]